MHLSMWGNTGNLTNSSVKFPSTGGKEACQNPTMSPPHREVSIGDLIYYYCLDPHREYKHTDTITIKC